MAGVIAADTFTYGGCKYQGVAPEMRGRVMALYMAIFMGGTPLGSPLIGWMAEVVGIRITIMICGLIVAAAGATLFVILRRGPRAGSPVQAATPVKAQSTNA